MGLIVPSTILNQVDACPLRKELVDRGLFRLINLGKDVFTTKVLNTSTIAIASPGDFVAADLSTLPLETRKVRLNETTGFHRDWNVWVQEVKKDPHSTFFLGLGGETSLLSRLRSQHPQLVSHLVGPIQRGVSPDVVAAHVISPAVARMMHIEPEVLRDSISGPMVKKYLPCVPNQFVIYTSKKTPIKKYPKALEYINQFKEDNTCKEVIVGKHPYWALHRARDWNIFRSAKFIGITTSKRIELVYDADGNLCVTDAMYVCSSKCEYRPDGADGHHAITTVFIPLPDGQSGRIESDSSDQGGKAPTASHSVPVARE